MFSSIVNSRREEVGEVEDEEEEEDENENDDEENEDYDENDDEDDDENEDDDEDEDEEEDNEEDDQTQDDLIMELLRAETGGEHDEERFQGLFGLIQDVNLHDELNGWTLLINACALNKPALIHFLLNNGADVNRSSKDGKTTPLTVASQMHSHLVPMLLENGADVNLAADDIAPLFLACKRGNTESVELLLAHGAKIDIASNNQTPLFWSCQTRNTKIIEMLLAHGANVNFKGYNGVTPFHSACKNGDAEIAELLLDKSTGQVDILFSLCVASELGHVDVVQLILTHRASMEKVKIDKHVALGCASEEGQVEVARLLLDHGAYVDGDGYCMPLHIASESNRANVVELLIGRGASVDLARVDGETPLSLACRNEAWDAMKHLVVWHCTTGRL